MGVIKGEPVFGWVLPSGCVEFFWRSIRCVIQRCERAGWLSLLFSELSRRASVIKMLWLVFFIIESFLKRTAARRGDPARQMCLSLFFVMRRDLRCAGNALIWNGSRFILKSIQINYISFKANEVYLWPLDWSFSIVPLFLHFFTKRRYCNASGGFVLSVFNNSQGWELKMRKYVFLDYTVFVVYCKSLYRHWNNILQV